MLIAAALVTGGLTLGGCATTRAAVRYPSPLAPGGTIGICAPSAGVPKAIQARYLFSIDCLKRLGYCVVTEGTIVTDEIVSAPADVASLAVELALTPHTSHARFTWTLSPAPSGS